MTTRAIVLALVCSSLPAWALVPGGGSAGVLSNRRARFAPLLELKLPGR
jgi:hypothetical protein